MWYQFGFVAPLSQRLMQLNQFCLQLYCPFMLQCCCIFSLGLATVLAAAHEERTDLESAVLNLPVNLCSSTHLWS